MAEFQQTRLKFLSGPWTFVCPGTFFKEDFPGQRQFLNSVSVIDSIIWLRYNVEDGSLK